MAKKKNDPWAGVVWTTTPQPGDEILQSPIPSRRGYGYKGGGIKHRGSPGASPIAVRRGAVIPGHAVIPDHAGYAVIPDRYSVATKPAKTRPAKTRPAAARRAAKSMTPYGIRAEGIRMGQAAHSATSHPLPPEVLQTAKERPSKPTLKQVRIDDLLSDSQRHREEQEKLYPITLPTARQADHSAREETFLGDMVMGRMLRKARINSLLEKTKAGDLANEMSLNNLIEKSMSERSKIEKLLRGSGDYKERTAELLNSTPKPKKKKKKKK